MPLGLLPAFLVEVLSLQYLCEKTKFSLNSNTKYFIIETQLQETEAPIIGANTIEIFVFQEMSLYIFNHS